MSKTLRIGMVGLDTSHVPAFANLLHDSTQTYHVPGGRIAAAFPGGSPDFALSINRVDGFTSELRDKHGVEIVDALSALRGKCDAVMLESIDGRVHLAQFREVADWGVPVFIDKPLTISGAEARELAGIAAEKNVRVTSASAIRFAEKFREALDDGGAVTGADVYGPMQFQEKCPGYFWYGIHAVEMLFAALGAGCSEVLAVREESHDVLTGRWSDGRIGTVRGNRTGNNGFGGTLHRAESSRPFDVSAGKKPYYASLLEKVMPFFQGESAVVAPVEMVEVIRFLDAANRSAATREWVAL
ncbi:MAG TPA: Gfo/Idh/MocA family oxidoreductase [Terrimicrobiaceae bacterium]|nr:Gfo/Idh/MocA family oxidoreductase [Terrimicrobiaceae bacterium]